MIPSAKYVGNLTKEFWGSGLNFTPLNNAVVNDVTSDIASAQHQRG